MVADAPASYPLSRTSRVVLVVGGSVAVAAVVTKVISMWMFSGFAPAWMILPVALVPAGLATAWATSRLGRRVAFFVATLASLACLLVAWWSWVPEPAIFGALRAHQTADTAVAEHLLQTLPWGHCQPAARVDLGPLRPLGTWDSVCVYGPPHRPSSWTLDLEPSSKWGSRLFFVGDGHVGEGCVARITGSWWVSEPSRSTDMNDLCPRGFSYIPGG